MCGGCPPGSCGPNATGSPSCARPVRRTAPGSCSWPPGGRPRPSRPASRPAPTTRPPPSRSRPWPGAGGAGGTWPRPGSGWCWPSTRCGPPPGRPTRRPSGSGVLRRAQQRHLGWMEAHDAELRVQERAVAREDAWRRRVDQRALALDPPGWLLAELGPVPTDPQERAVWRVAAAELDGYRRAYGLDHPGPAKHGWGRVARDGRAGCAGHPARRRAGRWDRAGSPGAAAAASTPIAEATAGSRPTLAAGQRHRVDPERLLGAEPRRQTPGRRRDWQAARAALERLAGWSHHRHRDDQRPPDRERPGRRLDRDHRPSGTRRPLVSWQKGAAHAPAPRPRRPRRGRGGPGGAGHARLPGQRPVGAGPDRRGAPAVPGRPRRPARPSGWAAAGPPWTHQGTPRGSPDPSGAEPGPRTPAGGAGRAGHRQPGQPRPLRPGRSTGGGAPPSWPPGPAAWPGGRRWSPPPACVGRRARRPGRPAAGPGWSAWPSRRWSAGGCGSAPPSRPAPGSAAPQGSGAPPACWTASPATATWSSTTWPCPARPPTSTTW